MINETINKYLTEDNNNNHIKLIKKILNNNGYYYMRDIKEQWGKTGRFSKEELDTIELALKSK